MTAATTKRIIKWPLDYWTTESLELGEKEIHKLREIREVRELFKYDQRKF